MNLNVYSTIVNPRPIEGLGGSAGLFFKPLQYRLGDQTLDLALASTVTKLFHRAALLHAWGPALTVHFDSKLSLTALLESSFADGEEQQGLAATFYVGFSF